MTLAQADQKTPPPDGIGKYGEALMHAAFNGITEQDVSEIVGGLVKKAKEGHTASINAVLNFVTGAAKGNRGPGRPAGSSDRPARRVDPDDDDSVVVLPSKVPAAPGVTALRRLCARIIAEEGPTHLAGLAGQCELTDAEARHVLACDWFRETPGGYELTPDGRRAVK